jgi:predicted GNAT superfamily acetyltransferase
MSKTAPQSPVSIRDLDTIDEFESVRRLEKKVWELSDADVTPLTLTIALRAAGSMLIGAFDGDDLIGFAFAFPSFEHGSTGWHSHMLAVDPAYREHGLGYRLKVAQRDRALALGIKEITWTFDPLRSTNAHLNFSKLGVTCDTYKVDFYGPQTSSSLHTNGTDRLWVTWSIASQRVAHRLAGKDLRLELLETLRHVPALIRFNGDGRPAESDLTEALSRQRLAIEIPGDIDRIEREDRDLARQWRLATRHAFTAATNSGFVVTEFCRSVRGNQGPGAYLLERREK